MQRSWARRAAALLCVVIVLFMAMTLSASPSSHDHVPATLTALWSLFAVVVIVLLRPGAPRRDEQPVSLRSLAPFRAPPAPLALA